MRLALGTPLAVGHQVHVGRTRTEQQARVDVGVACPGTEVEWLCASGADHLALSDVVAPVNRE